MRCRCTAERLHGLPRPLSRLLQIHKREHVRGRRQQEAQALHDRVRVPVDGPNVRPGHRQCAGLLHPIQSRLKGSVVVLVEVHQHGMREGDAAPSSRTQRAQARAIELLVRGRVDVPSGPSEEVDVHPRRHPCGGQERRRQVPVDEGELVFGVGAVGPRTQSIGGNRGLLGLLLPGAHACGLLAGGALHAAGRGTMKG